MVSLSDIVQVILTLGLSLSDFDGAVLRLAIKIRGNDRPSFEDCATPDQFSPQSTSVARKKRHRHRPLTALSQLHFSLLAFTFYIFQAHILCTRASV